MVPNPAGTGNIQGECAFGVRDEASVYSPSQGGFPWIPAPENRGIAMKFGMVEDREQGGDLILHELGEKNVPGADAETRWSQDGEGRSWEWEFCPRGNSWWLRIPSAG